MTPLILAVGLLCGIAYVSQRVFGDAFAPIGLFLGMNLASFALYLAGGVPYFEPSRDLILMFGVIVATFVGGSLLADHELLLTGVSAFREATRRGDEQRYFARRFFIATAMLGLIGWLALGYLLSRRMSLLLVLANPDMLQSEFQTVPFVGYLNVLNILVGPAFVLLWRRYGYFRWWMLLALLSGLVGLFLAGIKSYFTFGVMGTVMTYFSFDRSPKNILRLGGVMAFALTFFVFYDTFIDVGVAVGKPPWYNPYDYVAGSWPALGELITGTAPDRPMPGLHLFYSFYKLRNLFFPSYGELPGYVLDFRSIPGPFNVYTMNGESFYDFGWIGVVVFLAAFAYLVTRVRLRAVRSDRAMDHMLGGIVGYFIFMSFFVSFITHFFAHVMIVYVLLWRVAESRALRRVPSHAV